MEKSKREMATLLVISILLGVMCLFLNGIGDEPKQIEKWLKTHYRAKEKISDFHFYLHDLQKGNNVTAATVAQANITATSPTLFGLITMMDDPLTVGPDLSSRAMGYAQGLYADASFEDFSILCAVSFVFTEGKNNGSTISILGHNPTTQKFREMPIVGGTGRFRLARGMVTFETNYFNYTTGIAIIEVHGVVLHY